VEPVDSERLGWKYSLYEEHFRGPREHFVPQSYGTEPTPF
jgi:hypothetical protein